MKTLRFLLRGLVGCAVLLGAAVAPAQQASVCAQVTIKLDQDAVITRTAFRGTLTITDSGATPLQQVRVTLSLLDANRQPADALFGVPAPQLTGLTAIDGTGVLTAASTGTAEWTIVPTREAAPSGPTPYFVGGTLSYMQSGVQVTVPLYPAPISVLPDASLVVKYFQQRDVYSDDPFTPQIEPAEPFALGLLMTNSGLGTARNVTITSAQPQIVENAKGLLVSFKIIGTQVGAQTVAPSLTAHLGDLGPGASTEAVWFLTSSLQGEFTSYQASFRHADDFGNAKTSLIDHVEIHELIHVVRIDSPGADQWPDFLVNDQPTASPLPTGLYSSDGAVFPVTSGTVGSVNAAPTAGAMDVTLTAPLAAGWAYLEIDDPAGGNFPLAGVRRSDGREISIGDNAWTTQRTKHPVGAAAQTEKRLHLLDFNSTGSYTLTYGVRPVGVQFLSDTYTVPEGPGQATVTVQRTGNSTGAVTVKYATGDETAVAGVDYTSVHGTLSFAKGETAKTIAVPMLADKMKSHAGAGKTFTINLSEATGGAVVATPSTARIAIASTAVRSFATSAGVYSGVFQAGVPSAGLEGFLKVSVTANGQFTATIQLGGKTYRLAGKFDGSGLFSGSIPGGRTGSILVRLQLDLASGSNQVTGALSKSGFTADLTADRNVFNKTTHRAPQAGAYTVAFSHPPDPALPQGDGYGTVKVDAAGNVRFVGALGDGTKVSQSATLSQLGVWPLYLSLAGGKGVALGVLTFEDSASANDLDGTVTWFRPPNKGYPNGFTTSVGLIGSQYLPPPPGTSVLDLGPAPNNGLVTLAGGNLAAPLIETVTLGTNNKIVANPLKDAFQMQITLSTGLFHGSFVDARKKIRLFNGVVLQTQEQGSGLFLGAEQSGSVELRPQPVP